MSQCLWGIFSGIMLFGNSSVEMYLWNSFVENLLGNPLSPFIQAYMFIRNLRVWIGLPCPPQPLLFHICAGCTKGVFHVGEGAWVPWDFFRSVNPISSRNQGRLCPPHRYLLTYIPTGTSGFSNPPTALCTEEEQKFNGYVYGYVKSLKRTPHVSFAALSLLSLMSSQLCSQTKIIIFKFWRAKSFSVILELIFWKFPIFSQNRQMVDLNRQIVITKNKENM